MDLSRLRGGELIAAAGGIVLLFSLLFLNWYGVEGLGGAHIADAGAWDDQGFLGLIANLIILAAGIVAVGLAVLTATSRTVALPVAASALTAAGGVSAVVMVLLRMLFQPEVEVVGIPETETDLNLPIWVALLGAIGVAVGGWRSMQEEGTTFEEARGQLQRTLADSRRARTTPPPRPPAAPAEPSPAPREERPPAGEEPPWPDEPPRGDETPRGGERPPGDEPPRPSV